MNRFLILVSFLLLISAIPLRANATTDPNIGVLDPPCFEGCPIPNFTPVSGALGTSFTFNADGSGGGISFFQTASAINTVDIETIDPAITLPSQVPCYSDAFACTVTILDGVTDIYFSESCGEIPCTGVPAGNEFAVNLNDTTCDPFVFPDVCDNNGAGGWGVGEAFTAFPNVPLPTKPLIPEPSTGSLLALGVLGLLAAKNKKKFGEVLRSL